MPQAIPAVVAAISYVGSAASAVVAGTATLAQIATVAAVGIGAGVGGIAAAKALTPEIGSQGAAVRWEANPDAPLRFAFGRVGVKGSIIDAAIYGPDRMYVSFACTVSAAGPIKRFVSFRAGDYYMTFDSAGAAVNEPYRGEMWLSTRLGAQPDTALSLPSGLKNGAAFPGWNSGRKLSGSACYLVTLGENSKRSAYEGKVPAFVTVIEGLFCYDPRQDSTYPGGSGACRLNNPATWVWTQNPILFALKWTLGLWEGPTGKGAPQVDYQVGGIGAKVESIRLTTVVEAANMADANGWTSAAWPSTDDDKAQVLDGFLKAGGARYAEIAGQIAFIHRAAPRAPVFTVRARDTAGPVEIDTASSKLNRINTVRPRYWSEAHEWEMTALPEVTATEWQIEDGQGVAVKRTRGADYTFVDQPKQARELASLEISNSREGIRGRVPLRPYMDPEPGNTFIFDEPDFALSNLKCIVLKVEDNTENDTVVVTFETETDGKYPYAYGQTPSPPPAQELDPYDPTYVTPPLPIDWTITPRPGSGAGLPTFDLSGVVSNDTATSLLVEFYEVPSGANPNDTPPVDTGWQSAGVWPPTATSIPITVQPDRYYWVGVKYIRNSNYSDRQVWGPYLAGKLLAEVPADDPIWEDLYQSAKDLLKGAIEDAQALLEEERKREIGVADVLDRLGLGLLLDPVERTALIKSETLVEGVGPTGLPETLVQMRTRLVAADAANAASAAQALIDAKVYTDGLRNDAAIAYATYTAMGTAISASAASVQSWTTAQIAGAVANLVTASQLATSLATAKGQWESYATAAAARAVIGLDTVAAREAALATAKGQWESYATAAAARAVIGLDTVAAREAALATAKGQWESYASAAAASAVIGLDTVALREAAIAATVLQLRSETTEAITTATATLATQTSLNGVSAIAALALSTANGNEAYAALSVEANNWLTSIRVNGVSRSIDFVSEVFSLRSSSSGIRSEYRGGVWYIYDPDAGVRTMYGKSFGGSAKLQWWTGPASITEGSETKANAFVYIAMTAPRFGGSDVVASGGLGYTAGSMSVARGTSPTTIATLTSSTSTSLVEVSSTAASDGPESEAPVVTTYLYGVSGGVETLLASKAMTPGGVGDPITYVFPPVQAAYPTFRVKVRGTGPSSATGIANVDVTLKITPLATA